MRVIITGGTGLIGTALMKSLAEDGHEVIAISRNPRQKEPLPPNASFASWDAKTADGWGHLVDGADAVVQLAGASIAGDGFLPARWTSERKKLILDSRVNTGHAVVEAIEQAENKPRVLIQASAVGYYGTHPMDVDITESSPAGDDFLADVCKQWEASTEAVEAMGVRRPIIRTGVVLDEDEGALPRMALPFKMYAGGPLGSGKQPLPWIHLADEVRAIRFLIEEEEAEGAFNLAAPNPLTNAEFGKELGKVLNRPSFFPTPAFAFSMAFGEVADIVLKGQKALPKKLLDMGYQFTHETAQEALEAIYKGEKALATA